MEKIIEIEIGFPKSIVQYEGEPTSKLVSTEKLLVDLLERLRPIYKEDSDLYEKYDKQRFDFIEQLKNK